MGTFHDDHDERHGMTVVVFSSTPRTYVGRWDKQENGYALIRDANMHDSAEDERTRGEFLESQKTYGVEVKFPYLTIPEGEITEVVQLRDVQPG